MDGPTPTEEIGNVHFIAIGRLSQARLVSSAELRSTPVTVLHDGTAHCRRFPPLSNPGENRPFDATSDLTFTDANPTQFMERHDPTTTVGAPFLFALPNSVPQRPLEHLRYERFRADLGNDFIPVPQYPFEFEGDYFVYEQPEPELGQ